MARGFNYAPGASEEVELAGAPSLPREQVAALSLSRNAVVREVLAARRDLALGQMVSFAHDRSTEVRTALAANPTAPGTVLDHLAGDKHVPVLEALLANPSTPVEVVERLAFHRKSEVRLAAVRRIDDADAGSAQGTAPAPGTRFASSAPELQDRAVGFGSGDVVDIATGLPVRPGLAVPPATRTAPVRGFRPPSE